MKPCLGPYFRVCCFSCSKGRSKSVQVLFTGIEAVMVLTFVILKQRAPFVAVGAVWLG